MSFLKALASRYQVTGGKEKKLSFSVIKSEVVARKQVADFELMIKVDDKAVQEAIDSFIESHGVSREEATAGIQKDVDGELHHAVSSSVYVNKDGSFETSSYEYLTVKILSDGKEVENAQQGMYQDGGFETKKVEEPIYRKG